MGKPGADPAVATPASSAVALRMVLVNMAGVLAGVAVGVVVERVVLLWCSWCLMVEKQRAQAASLVFWREPASAAGAQGLMRS